MTFTVTKRDGSIQEIEVRKLAIPQFEALLRSIGDELAMASCYTGLPRDWSKSLRLDSLFALVDAGEKENPDFFVWARRRSERIEKISPGVTSRIAQAFETRRN